MATRRKPVGPFRATLVRRLQGRRQNANVRLRAFEPCEAVLIQCAGRLDSSVMKPGGTSWGFRQGPARCGSPRRSTI
jgi:hypothetical protein